ncbi:AraC family transcriptional regulator [Paraherbaspirillum soli]|uniref:AraC family transcriptional regulator n=1 Tax=Paraherbaspirillum soli TaxID=631222 RepID=A0ABW0M6R4_9BURK
MLLAGQSARHYEVPAMTQLPRPLFVRALEIPERSSVAMHSHPWAQFLYATSGVLNVQTPQGHSMVPPQYAVWIPPHMPHAVSTYHRVSFHSLYLGASALENFEQDCTVLNVTPLLRELIMATAGMAVDYDVEGRDGRLVAVIVDQIKDLAAAPLTVPMPLDSRLLKIAVALQASPGESRSLDDWGELVGATRRTLARLFRKETGLSFTEWRQAIRLLASLPRLEAGEAVTSVASELGYESTSAFIALFQRRYGMTPGRFVKQSHRLNT